MHIEIDKSIPMPKSGPDMVGNVYPIRGGFGARNGRIEGKRLMYRPKVSG